MCSLFLNQFGRLTLSKNMFIRSRLLNPYSKYLLSPPQWGLQKLHLREITIKRKDARRETLLCNLDLAEISENLSLQ